MVVNLNPGAVGGGSGGQYFVGEFDGTTFTSESTEGAQSTPAGDVFAGFDDGTFDGWTLGNEPGNGRDGPWGLAPASGALDGQSPVTGVGKHTYRAEFTNAAGTTVSRPVGVVVRRP